MEILHTRASVVTSPARDKSLKLMTFRIFALILVDILKDGFNDSLHLLTKKSLSFTMYCRDVIDQRDNANTTKNHPSFWRSFCRPNSSSQSDTVAIFVTRLPIWSPDSHHADRKREDSLSSVDAPPRRSSKTILPDYPSSSPVPLQERANKVPNIVATILNLFRSASLFLWHGKRDDVWKTRVSTAIPACLVGAHRQLNWTRSGPQYKTRSTTFIESSTHTSDESSK